MDETRISSLEKAAVHLANRIKQLEDFSPSSNSNSSKGSTVSDPDSAKRIAELELENGKLKYRIDVLKRSLEEEER